MFKTNITPRIGETDALRHITNTALPVWFEYGRNELFKIFNPTNELTYKKWNLILVHMDFNYIRQTYFGYDVEIRTYITKIGKTSFTVMQEAWQNGILRSNGTAVMVYYDFVRQESNVIPEDIRSKLKEHFISLDELEEKNRNEMRNNRKVREFDYVESDL
ncbi:thioesterase family protein [Methanosphaera sp. ISO3-F5]|uniref:acyl-CoA thioesterase n=1 Tax=Methanosphaera sp. ISO3-F5 TaxID=1452353 RepID=UPI002B264185|nr:thioesterase family protein [Methanosphaera sp. ISO3-F5]WQH64520.1 thioesterase family protein [Methanosphaera sp. ISO3-F5]